MFNLDKFISESVTFRPVSMFAADIEANKEQLTREIKGKKVCVIGGAGSIGSSFINAVLRFEPGSVVVVDLNENGLAELVRDVRSTEYFDGTQYKPLYVPDEFRAATDFKMDYAKNAVYLSDRQIKLSASSAFYLKMAARFAFFLSSVEEDGMMYPRLLFSDNMEDKGMEEDRSRNFQHILVQRLKEMGRTDYQVIFATSNIAPELDTPEYTIGEYYMQSNKSLKDVN